MPLQPSFQPPEAASQAAGWLAGQPATAPADEGCRRRQPPPEDATFCREMLSRRQPQASLRRRYNMPRYAIHRILLFASRQARFHCQLSEVSSGFSGPVLAANELKLRQGFRHYAGQALAVIFSAGLDSRRHFSCILGDDNDRKDFTCERNSYIFFYF